MHSEFSSACVKCLDCTLHAYRQRCTEEPPIEVTIIANVTRISVTVTVGKLKHLSANE